MALTPIDVLRALSQTPSNPDASRLHAPLLISLLVPAVMFPWSAPASAVQELVQFHAHGAPRPGVAGPGDVD